ncbi:Gmad2 immunoglobulin-like domain-containing protein [Paenibacillus allorhizosphaerae]|uniref:Bacterial spore germination immunoglobulin-like domain-containing protein n=1 Tax=Paenibacillus allorhizosphaerae TaxID=2849866 RepID=A0ABM8VH33_9BACL|nr:Gmad2 immunoglobulin-like domain-containing protein [Paenibacillus allorhizosphaerae]CAG7638786.1 hypothetical protein PAECIP111802_02476 [Paenibacillus allorhizosphaerae]
MRHRKAFLILAMLCSMMLTASCQPGSRSTDSAANQTPSQKTTAVKALDKGNIVLKDGNRWLITAYVNKNGTSSIDAFWFTVNEQTELLSTGGQKIQPENMAIGAEVEAWHTGKVAESYPAQTVAAKIVMHDDTQAVPTGMIGQTKAVQQAMQSQTKPTAAKAVKSALLDADKGVWKIELVQHEAAEQPMTIQVDARSGQIIRTPVAENDAFRIFSPIPGTKAGPAFTVEGEARVFEAAFSWTLEDGHAILAEGHERADKGAPAWGRFRFDVNYEQASQPNMMLILFIHSAKDGSVEHELIIPLKVPEDRIHYSVEANK